MIRPGRGSVLSRSEGLCWMAKIDGHLRSPRTLDCLPVLSSERRARNLIAYVRPELQRSEACSPHRRSSSRLRSGRSGLQKSRHLSKRFPWRFKIRQKLRNPKRVPWRTSIRNDQSFPPQVRRNSRCPNCKPSAEPSFWRSCCLSSEIYGVCAAQIGRTI